MGWHDGRVATRSAGFCEEHQRLDIRALHHCGLLLGPPFGWQWSRNGERRGDIQIWPVNEDVLILKYQVRSGNGPWQAVEDTIRLDWTTVHFGGRRPWFRCPGCGRRVALLYADTYFRCWRCLRLVHAVCHESRLDQLFRKARKLRVRLVGDDDFGGINWPISKPKGMHRRKFARLRAKAYAAAARCTVEAEARFGPGFLD